MLGGDIPNNASDLLKELPGVGRYTAGAIASIAFGQATGVVDGNVIRVLSRLRAIGAESSGPKTVEKFWQLANLLVDPKRPGDFNQGMMELGATVCTPQSPLCDKCPLNSYCFALNQVKEHKTKATEKLITPPTREIPAKNTDVKDIEECGLCLPQAELWDMSLGVCNYPRKPKKKQVKEEYLAVCILERMQEHEGSVKEYLIIQRPTVGLLAGLWEFPNLPVDADWMNEKVRTATDTFLREEIGIELQKLEPQRSDAQLVHNFSHIRHHYKVQSYTCVHPFSCSETSRTGRTLRWVSGSDIGKAALSTGMKKVYAAYKTDKESDRQTTRKRKRSGRDEKQMKLDGFFKPKK